MTSSRLAFQTLYPIISHRGNNKEHLGGDCFRIAENDSARQVSAELESLITKIICWKQSWPECTGQSSVDRYKPNDSAVSSILFYFTVTVSSTPRPF